MRQDELCVRPVLQQGRENHDLRNRLSPGKDGSLPQQVRLRDVQQLESFQQQIEQLLRQEFTNEPCTQAKEHDGEPYKPKTETYKGKILVINDAPSVSKCLAKWLTEMGYRYTFVDSVDEVHDLLEQVDFDTIVHGHEFFFTKGLQGFDKA